MRHIFLIIIVSVLSMKSAQAQNAAPFWSLAGNSNASPGSKLGTTNYTPMILKTNNASRIYIAPDGKVGIGTTSPISLFNVQGQTLLSIFTSTDTLSAISGSGVIGYTKFLPTATGQRLGYFLTGSQGGSSGPGNGTGMVGYADGAWNANSHPAYLTFETTRSGNKSRSEAMRIGSTGYVGIGTANPTHRLHVVDTSTAIFAEGLGANSYGVYASGSNVALYGSGNNAGVYGTGKTYGVYGSGTVAGSYGYGNVGVFGESSTSNGEGVHGVGFGFGGYGGSFSSTNFIGLYANTSNSTSYAGYFQGNLYSTGNYVGSDKRLKKDIAEFSDAVSIIKKLKPRTYEFQTEGKMAQMNLPKGKHYGLIAQDVESVLPDIVKETPQLSDRIIDSSGKAAAPVAGQQIFKAVNYTELIPILIKGMQEQDEKLQEQDEKLQKMDALEAKVQALEATVRELKAILTNNTTGSLSSASLEVPIPNPAKGSTNIHYSVPAGIASARLTVVNMLGQVMKEVKLSGGIGQVNLNVSGLAAGTYPCTLWVNGQQAVSKQLVVSH